MSSMPGDSNKAAEELTSPPKDPPFWLWGAGASLLAITVELIFVPFGSILVLVVGTLLGALVGQIGGKLGGKGTAIVWALLVGAATPVCVTFALFYFIARDGGY